MATIPLSSDPEVLERIYQRFAYLRDHPLNLLASFIDEAVSMGELETEDFLGFLLAYEVEEERPTSAHFSLLTAEENLTVNRYRHVRPVEPWPQPIVGIAWDSERGEGKVTGTHRVDVVLKEVGNAQLWWGAEVGVLWEAFFDSRIRARSDHGLLMHQLWERLEGYLQEQGATRVYTHAHDPALDDAWYAAFLATRDYRLDEERRAMVKRLDT